MLNLCVTIIIVKIRVMIQRSSKYSKLARKVGKLCCKLNTYQRNGLAHHGRVCNVLLVCQTCTYVCV